MSRSRGLEYALVALIVLGAAFYARAEYIPPFADQHVAVAAEKYDLDIEAPGEWFSAWSLGDGQAFAVIAADPSGMKLSEEIKEAAYRYTRASYGWLSFAGSAGQEPWIPYGMAIAGALSVLATLGLAIWLRPQVGPRIWILLINPAIYIGFAGDTAEPLAIALLVWALASGSVIAAGLLGITRPTYLVALFGRWRQLGVGFAATLAILVYAFLRFGADDFLPDGGRIGFPFAAYFEHPSIYAWVLAAFALVTLAIGVKTRDWSWVLSALLILSIGEDVTESPENAWRAAGMLPVLWAFGPNHRVAGSSVRADEDESVVVPT